jgi:hypothetical protein
LSSSDAKNLEEALLSRNLTPDTVAGASADALFDEFPLFVARIRVAASSMKVDQLRPDWEPSCLEPGGIQVEGTWFFW